MKRKLVAGFVSASLLLSSSFAFSDLTPEHWAYEVVHKMQGKGIISGFLDNTFQPESSVTRGQFATMLVKTLDLPMRTEPSFFEDLDDHWARPYAESVAEFVDGKMIGQRSCFLPEEPAIREEVAMTVVRAKGLENKAYDTSTLDGFIDKDLISFEAQKYVAIAVENGIMKGNIDKTFNPKGKITRAEITALMHNLLQMPMEVPEEELPPEEMLPVVTPPVEVETVQPIIPPKPATNRDDSSVAFYEKYVSVGKKYAELVVTPVDDSTMEIQLTGYNELSGTFGFYQPINVYGKDGLLFVNGVEKLKFLLSGGMVKIEALDENYNIFEGEFVLEEDKDENLVDCWDLTYFIGKRPQVSSSDPDFDTVVYKSVSFTRHSSDEVEFNASAIVGGRITSYSGVGKLNGSTLFYDTEGGALEFTIDENDDLTINVSNSKYKDFEGFYLRQAISDKLNEHKNIVESTNISYGTIKFRD